MGVCVYVCILLSYSHTPHSALTGRSNCGFGISDFGFLIEELLNPHSALRTPHSAFRIPHSALRTPHSAFRIPHSAFRIPHSAFRTNRQIKLRIYDFGIRIEELLIPTFPISSVCVYLTPPLPYSHTPILPYSHTPILPYSRIPHSALPLVSSDPCRLPEDLIEQRTVLIHFHSRHIRVKLPKIKDIGSADKIIGRKKKLG